MLHWSKPMVMGDVPTQGLRSHTANVVGSKIYVYGGSDLSSEFNQLLIFDTETCNWWKPSPTGPIPEPRRAHSTTLVDNRLFVFGGGDGTSYFDNLYVLDVDKLHWMKPEVKGKPPSARRAHSSVLIGKKLFVFGGGDGNRALNETYVLDVEKLEWDMFKTTGEVPKPRGYHSVNVSGSNYSINVSAPAASGSPERIWVFGGSDGADCHSDIWVLGMHRNSDEKPLGINCFPDPNTGQWSGKKRKTPANCFAHSATTVGNWLMVFGGHDGSTQTSFNNDIKILNMDHRVDTLEFFSKPCSGTPPSPRGYSTSVCQDGRLFVFGGFDGKRCYGDMHTLELGIYAANAK